MGHRTGRHPRVSVIIASLDAAEHIARAIESVQAQDVSDFELIVADRGSRDRTRAICEGFSQRDFRIDLLPCDGATEGEALDAALAAARGAYVLVMGQADWLGTCALEPMLRMAEGFGADIVIPFYVPGGVRLGRGARARRHVAAFEREFADRADGKLLSRTALDRASFTFQDETARACCRVRLCARGAVPAPPAVGSSYHVERAVAPARPLAPPVLAAARALPARLYRMVVQGAARVRS